MERKIGSLSVWNSDRCNVVTLCSSVSHEIACVLCVIMEKRLLLLSKSGLQLNAYYKVFLDYFWYLLKIQWCCKYYIWCKVCYFIVFDKKKIGEGCLHVHMYTVKTNFVGINFRWFLFLKWIYGNSFLFKWQYINMQLVNWSE